MKIMPHNPGNTKDDGQRNQQGAGSQDKKNPSASQSQSSGQGGQKNSMGSGQNSGRGQENQKSSQGSQGSQQRGVSGGASSQNLRLQLTPEQQAQIRKATGRDASSLELSVEDIEDSLGESEGSMGNSSSGQSSSRGESQSKGDSDYDDEPSSGNRGNSASEF